MDEMLLLLFAVSGPPFYPLPPRAVLGIVCACARVHVC